MDKILAILKTLAPILEPLGEQGVNALFDSVITPALTGLNASNDMVVLAQCLSPGLKQFLILEIQKLK